MFRWNVTVSLLLVVAFILTGCDERITAPSDRARPAVSAHGGGPGGPPGSVGPGANGESSCDVRVPGDYGSIQAAVDAASSGAEVCVDNGTYREQVIIPKDLILRGIDNPTIEFPDSRTSFRIVESGPEWEPIVLAYGGSLSNGTVSGSETIDVSISGFHVDGRGLQPSVSRAVGIFFRNVQSTGGIAANTVENMAVGGAETMGILAYGNSDVTIANNKVDGYERGGIGANGDGGAHPSPHVVIRNNTVIGSGDGSQTAWGPNGIQIGYGATGRIVGNIVKKNRWANFASNEEVDERQRDDWVASCVLVFESDQVQIRNNEISNCDAGIGVGSWAFLTNSSDNVKVRNNTLQNTGVGMLLEAVTFSASGSDASLSNGKIVRNSLTAGSLGEVGIALSTIDASSQYNPVLNNNKIIANRIRGFENSIADEGSASKVHANKGSFSP